MLFKKKLKPIPRFVPGDFDGYPIKRVQFNHTGGFKVTFSKDGSDHCSFIPNDPRNRHCDYLRKWMAEGNFPEDPDPIQLTRYLGVTTVAWVRINLFLICVGTLAAGISGIYLALK